MTAASLTVPKVITLNFSSKEKTIAFYNNSAAKPGKEKSYCIETNTVSLFLAA